MSQSVTVKFDSIFRQFVGNNAQMEVEAESIGDLLQQIEKRYPGFSNIILSGGKNVRASVDFCLRDENNDMIKYTQDLSERCSENIRIVEIDLHDLGGG